MWPLWSTHWIREQMYFMSWVGVMINVILSVYHWTICPSLPFASRSKAQITKEKCLKTNYWLVMSYTASTARAVTVVWQSNWGGNTADWQHCFVAIFYSTYSSLLSLVQCSGSCMLSSGDLRSVITVYTYCKWSTLLLVSHKDRTVTTWQQHNCCLFYWKALMQHTIIEKHTDASTVCKSWCFVCSFCELQYGGNVAIELPTSKSLMYI